MPWKSPCTIECRGTLFLYKQQIEIGSKICLIRLIPFLIAPRLKFFLSSDLASETLSLGAFLPIRICSGSFNLTTLLYWQSFPSHSQIHLNWKLNVRRIVNDAKDSKSKSSSRTGFDWKLPFDPGPVKSSKELIRISDEILPLNMSGGYVLMSHLLDWLIINNQNDVYTIVLLRSWSISLKMLMWRENKLSKGHLSSEGFYPETSLVCE